MLSNVREIILPTHRYSTFECIIPFSYVEVGDVSGVYDEFTINSMKYDDSFTWVSSRTRISRTILKDVVIFNRHNSYLDISDSILTNSKVRYRSHKTGHISNLEATDSYIHFHNSRDLVFDFSGISFDGVDIRIYECLRLSVDNDTTAFVFCEGPNLPSKIFYKNIFYNIETFEAYLIVNNLKITRCVE